MDVSDASEDLRPHRDGKNLASGKESLLQQPPFSPEEQFERRGLSWSSVSWRLVAGLVCSAILLVCLSYYSTKDNIPTWDRRIFNTVTLLLSGLVSLCFGSLLHVLGGTLRWPLLARSDHTPHEVDLILGMHNPTGTIRLIGHQLRKHKWSATTFVALLYLVFTTISTLAVAAFGLVYNLKENVQVSYPVMVTNFGNKEFLIKDPPEYDDKTHVDWLRDAKDMLDSMGTLGQIFVPTMFNISDSSSFTMKNISGNSLDRTVNGSTVTYTYHLREYVGTAEYASSNRIIHSTSTCKSRYLAQDGIYSSDGSLLTARGNLTGDQFFCKFNVTNIPEYMDFLGALFCGREFDNDHQLGTRGLLWGMRAPYIKRHDSCATTHIFVDGKAMRVGTLLECKTCLTHAEGAPGLSTDIITKYPRPDVSSIAHSLLAYQVLGATMTFGGQIDAKNESLNYWLVKDFPDKEYILQNNTQFGIHSFNQARPYLPERELRAANLAARRPILTLIGAQSKLPRVTEDPNDKEQAFVITKLEVKWDRAIGILAGVLALNVALVLVTWFVSRKVPVIDHQSTLAVARLARTALSTVDTGPIAPTGRLADRVENVSGTIRYGTRRGTGEYSNLYQLDLWNDVRNEFPKKAKYV